MSSIVAKLTSLQLINPPPWLVSNTHLETLMGSVAYGVSCDTSDMDIYGFCIPPKDIIFPHLAGEILGFGKQVKRFEQYQQHHIKNEKSKNQKHHKTYDLNIFNIVKYFHLCMGCNPNMIDSLFTPTTCILHRTKVANMVREKRHLFLHKGAWHTFKGYAYSQLSSIDKNRTGKRKELVEKHGYDTKNSYHVVRLLNEIEMILIEHDLDLQRNNEQLKSIRRGEWTYEQVKEYFQKKESDLETLYTKSKLQWGPDEQAIKKLLIECLEEHYGNLKDCIILPDRYELAVKEIREIINRTV